MNRWIATLLLGGLLLGATVGCDDSAATGPPAAQPVAGPDTPTPAPRLQAD